MLEVTVTCIKLSRKFASAAGRSTPFTFCHFEQCQCVACLQQLKLYFPNLSVCVSMKDNFFSSSSSFVVPSFLTLFRFLPQKGTCFLGIRLLKELATSEIVFETLVCNNLFRISNNQYFMLIVTLTFHPFISKSCPSTKLGIKSETSFIL